MIKTSEYIFSITNWCLRKNRVRIQALRKTTCVSTGKLRAFWQERCALFEHEHELHDTSGAVYASGNSVFNFNSSAPMATYCWSPDCVVVLRLAVVWLAVFVYCLLMHRYMIWTSPRQLSLIHFHVVANKHPRILFLLSSRWRVLHLSFCVCIWIHPVPFQEG